jgi:hypothetical protein
MKHQIFGASHERAVKLMTAGCPIDYPDALPRLSFRAEQLLGYADSRILAQGPLDTCYVIALHLATDRSSGTIIKDWNFEPPWQDHFIDWDNDPEDIIPKQDWDVYKNLFKSRLMEVLKEGRKIRHGCRVDGVLCGRSRKPIGKSSHGFISAKLSFTDDLGNTVPLCIDLNVYSHSSANRPPVRGVGHGLSSDYVEPRRWVGPRAPFQIIDEVKGATSRC